MSDNMAKSCAPFHTTIICNIKSLTCTKLEKIEFAQKLPGHAQILEGLSGPEIFRDGSSHYFLQLLKFSAKSNDFFSRYRPKTSFWAKFGPKFGPRYFFRKSGFVTLNRLCYISRSWLQKADICLIKFSCLPI